jgi:hypothetical protein
MTNWATPQLTNEEASTPASGGLFCDVLLLTFARSGFAEASQFVVRRIAYLSVARMSA